MKIFFIFAAIIVMVTGFFLVEQQFVSNGQRVEVDGPLVPLRDVLRDIGKAYDCQFTIEIGLVLGDQTQSLANVPKLEVHSNSQLRGKSLKEVLDLLRDTVPNFEYEFSAKNSKVIHIMDSRLRKKVGYALNDTVNEFNFSGYFFDLVNLLSERGFKVSSKFAGDLREFNASDNSTHIKVSAKDSSVRSVLTDYIDLTDRGRVLWIAETDLGKNEITYIRLLNKNF